MYIHTYIHTYNNISLSLYMYTYLYTHTHARPRYYDLPPELLGKWLLLLEERYNVITYDIIAQHCTI